MTSSASQSALGASPEIRLAYRFGDGTADGDASMRELLGGKGAGLHEMSRLGVPVPPGFTIPTSVCNDFHRDGGGYPAGLRDQVRAGLAWVEERVGTRFGDAENPLLLSVRSGARASMPGMMDTVLNLGLNDRTAEGLARKSGDARFAYDSYRRFVAMYSEVVLGVKRAGDLAADPFEALLDAAMAREGVRAETDLSAGSLRELVGAYKGVVRAKLGRDFPDDPWEQFWNAIGAVFDSWNTQRAIVYRDLYGYPHDWGTACTVQSMVFGNLGDDCATGVCFTRDPKSGEPGIFGEYLVNAQGEDVVAGVRTPLPIVEAGRAAGAPPSMEATQPRTYSALAAACDRLEQHFRDMQDIEFTVQQGRLWILQTRSGKRTGPAMVRVATDLVSEGLIDRAEALRRMDPEQVAELLHPVFAEGAPRTVIATGLAASPGAAVGEVVFSAQEATERADQGAQVILVRLETSPEDIQGMLAAQGILTARGGMTSHAAVVARGWGTPCVSGCGSLRLDYGAGQFQMDVPGQGVVTVSRGDTISIDGSTGQVMLGAVPLEEAQLPASLQSLLGWADDVRRLRVRTNADTPTDAAKARAFGAEGIGLCRTEHMFFGPDRLLAVREMILADGAEARRAALAKILPIQREDFVGIFRAMDGYPVTVRLLDPPLHEFLPQTAAEQAAVAADLGISREAVQRRVEALAEFNPMLGHRGVRLAITYPEIYEVQTRAILEAACAVARDGVVVIPEIMAPLVAMASELATTRERLVRVAEQVFDEQGMRLAYTIGTMIELPRACVTADEIAAHADFFSFGTNDLTQTTFGLSRDDAGHFLPAYLEGRVLERDPFVELDRGGVGALVEIGVTRGRATRPDLKIGICGEHGGNPASVAFCHAAGFDYVSCSPYRVLIARLAAAQAALAE